MKRLMLIADEGHTVMSNGKRVCRSCHNGRANGARNERRAVVRLARAMLCASLLVILSSGCARTLGYAGSHPGRVACKGKGVITMVASGALVGGFGGGNTGNVSITGDCGEGFSFEQGPPSASPTPSGK